MVAQSIHGNSPGEIQNKLNQYLIEGFQPTLAIVFISIEQDTKAVAEMLHQKGIDVFGATSGGEFCNEHQSMGEIVILLLELDKSKYYISFEDVKGKDLADVSQKIARDALTQFDNPAFLLCSTTLTKEGEILNGEVLVENIEKIIGPDVTLFGGMAGDDGKFTGTYVFNHEKSTDDGIIAVILDKDKIDLHGMALSGWKKIGLARTITKSKGRLMYSIDNQPAVDMYLKYLGNENFLDKDKYKIFEAVGVHYPFQIQSENGESVMVTPMGINKDENALICEKELKEGSTLHFSEPPDFDIVETILQNASELKNEKQAAADALLIFSCIGRHTAMGPMAQEENEGLANIWKAPMAGFYTYGEFGRSPQGKRRMHSTTCSWVALKEK